MNTASKMIEYAKLCIVAYSDVTELDILPTPLMVYGETDYCGMLVSYGGETLARTYMILHFDNIVALAEHENIDLEQAVLETIFHEWIHHVQAVCHFGDIENMESHSNDLWKRMITIGMDQGFIHRENI